MGVKKHLMACLACLFIASNGWSASLGVWPINPQLNASESATAIWVKNNDAHPVRIQIRVMDWQQQQGEDHTNPQQLLVASPAMVAIEPNAQQLIRIVNRQGVTPLSATEKSYRIFIDEIPDKKLARENNSGSLNFQMRYSLPLFSGLPARQDKTTALAQEKDHRVTFEVIKDSGYFIKVQNQSPEHIRLSEVRAVSENQIGEPLTINDGLLGYVLPGSEMRWPLTRQQAEFINQHSASLVFRHQQKDFSIAQAGR